jgi:uncharacterized membrane protein
MDNAHLFGYLLFIIVLAAITERFLRNPKAKSRKNFSLFRYLLFLSVPLACSALIIYERGRGYLTIFIISILLGTVSEWLLGYYYEKIVGHKLWVYKRGHINGYTSWLIMPVWGFTGVLFALLTAAVLKK